MKQKIKDYTKDLSKLSDQKKTFEDVVTKNNKEIQDAINFVESWRSAVKSMGGDKTDTKEMDNAINVLRQIKKEPCECCSDLGRYKGFGYAELFHQIAADDTYEINIDVKYCPNCGRRLTEVSK